MTRREMRRYKAEHAGRTPLEQFALTGTMKAGYDGHVPVMGTGARLSRVWDEIDARLEREAAVQGGTR